MRRNQLTYAGVLALICFLSAGCKSTPAATPMSVPVQVSTVERVQVGTATRYSASILPNAQIALVFKSGGYTASIMQVRGADGRSRAIDAGDRVEQGDVLATVKTDEYQDRISGAQAELARASVSETHAKTSMDLAATLFAGGSATKPEYDQAKAQFEMAQAAVSAAKAQLSAANTQLSDTILKAPISGWIAKRSIDVGSLVGPGAPAFVLVDTRLVRAAFGVPDMALQSVHLGQKLLVTAEAVRGEFAGQVTSIAPAADPGNRVYSVEITLANPEGKLKSGMIASVTVGQQKQREVTVIPMSSVLRSSDNPDEFSVMVSEQSTRGLVARLRKVRLGDPFGNSIEVISGVLPGERVVTTGAALLHEGDRLQLPL